MQLENVSVNTSELVATLVYLDDTAKGINTHFIMRIIITVFISDSCKQLLWQPILHYKYARHFFRDGSLPEV